MRQAVVNVDIAPLYRQAQQMSERTDEALYGMCVDILEEQRGWCRVRTPYRYEGWMLSGCLLADEQAVRIWRGAALHMVRAPYIDVLDAPRVQGGHLQGVPRGSLLCVQGEKDAEGWVRVRLADGVCGYTKASYLSSCAAHGEGAPEAALRRAVCDAALSYLGAQYRWGGKTLLGIDCSGLASMAYWLNGIMIYRDAALREDFPLCAIPFEQAGPGDLLFFPGHVAVYLGGGRFVHATAHAGAEGVVYGSFREEDEGFRPDLKRTLVTAGSLFGGG